MKGTLDEELWDVLYYTLCLAEAYGIDMEEAIREKERLNNLRWHDEHPFEMAVEPPPWEENKLVCLRASFAGAQLKNISGQSLRGRRSASCPWCNQKGSNLKPWQ